MRIRPIALVVCLIAVWPVATATQTLAAPTPVLGGDTIDFIRAR